MYLSVGYELLTGPEHDGPGAALSALGLSALELCLASPATLPALSPDGPPSFSVAEDAGARAYRSHLHRFGLRVSALSVGLDVTAETDEALLRHLVVAIRASDILGASVVGISPIPAADPEGKSPISSPDLVGLLQRACRATPDSRVALAVPVAPSAGEVSAPCRALAAQASGRLGLTLDPARLYEAGLSLADGSDIVRPVAPFVRRLLCRGLQAAARNGPHTQDVPLRTRCPLAGGDIDYAHILCRLGAVGYAGAVTLTAPPAADPGSPSASPWLREDADFLRELLGKDVR